MFKKILMAALVVATASFAEVGMGAHVGGTMTSMWGDDAKDVGSGFGFNAGISAKLAIPFVALVPEVLIDMRNITEESKLGDITTTEWALEIPIMARLSLLPILYLEAGPTLAFNLGVSSEDDNGNEIEYDDDAFESFEFGLAFGLGTGIIPFLDVDFRMNMGLTKIVAEPKIGEAPDTKNLQFALGVTYWFL